MPLAFGAGDLGEVADGGGLSVLPGVTELLAALPADRWTVVTSATERLARTRLGQAGLPVPARLITADDVAQGKPLPDPYLAGAALLGVPAAKFPEAQGPNRVRLPQGKKRILWLHCCRPNRNYVLRLQAFLRESQG